MKRFQLFALLLTAVILVGLCACDKEEFTSETDISHIGISEKPDDRRDYRVHPKGNNEDVVTVMLYLCGSDLEEKWGAATADLNEVLYGKISKNVNIIIETGGAREWQNNEISADTNTRFKATNDGLEKLVEVGLKDMTDPSTLTDFITYCADEYPADRYMLVMWDHGGGTLGGYAVDRNFPQSNSMSITEINQVLRDAGVVFDFIGFDACLMATAETAFMLERYADYMISSQRIEPGNGWYYTDWITALSKNTSIDTVELGTIIADTYIDHNYNKNSFENELTLSVVDLTYVNSLFASLYDFFDSADDMLVHDKQFAEISQARYDSRALSDNYDQVDIAYLVENMDLQESDRVSTELDKCVAYNATTIENHNGLCLYFPYTDLYNVEGAISIFDAIGISDNYQDFITTFASLMAGGQTFVSGTDWEDVDWIDEELIDDYQDYYEENSYSNDLEIEEKDDYWVLNMSQEDWDLITSIQLCVYVLTDGYRIDLGSDNLYEFDDDGDLIVDFDYTWVAIEGNVVPFYAIEEQSDDDGWYSYGYSPCYVNGEVAELIIMWDSAHPGGYVPGYRYVYEGSITQKGYIPLNDGDEVQFRCDIYSDDFGYEGAYEAWTLYVDGELDVSYESIGDVDCEIFYFLTDIYGNYYWTESLLYS